MVVIRSSAKVEPVLSFQTAEPLKGPSQASRVHQLVVSNEPSYLKGLLWGIAGFGFAKVTLDCFFTSLQGATMHDSLTILDDVWNSKASMESANAFLRWRVFPHTLVETPIAPSMLTFAFGLITSKCYRNSEYHLGSRQVKQIQISK